MIATIIATQMASHNPAPIPIVGCIAISASVRIPYKIKSARTAAARTSNEARIRLRWWRGEETGTVAMVVPFARRAGGGFPALTTPPVRQPVTG